jgi:hypothetical protein
VLFIANDAPRSWKFGYFLFECDRFKDLAHFADTKFFSATLCDDFFEIALSKLFMRDIPNDLRMLKETLDVESCIFSFCLSYFSFT